MSEALTGPFEFGKFDLTSLPIDWNSIPPKEIDKLQRTLENSMIKQKAQLERRKALKTPEMKIEQKEILLEFKS